ncbi:MAG TPA: hypothetical protein VGR13_04355 [Actinomycetota bacterium]|jgi:hypothetical protein|nr:hypothetical protein [Actinomycetota bacterium]
MPRRTFDKLMSFGGVVLTAALLIAGVLAFWGYNFANTKVHEQLAAQQIFFPPAGSEALADPAIGPYLNKYAGEQLVNGAQAQAYADHFIAVHLKGVADGKTYAEVSTLSRQNPDDQELAGQVQTLFRGETLRGLLLNAYAFWKLGQLALIGAIAFWAMAGVMFVLTILGFWHLRRVPATEQIFAPAVRNSEERVTVS